MLTPEQRKLKQKTVYLPDTLVERFQQAVKQSVKRVKNDDGSYSDKKSKDSDIIINALNKYLPR